MKLWLYANYNVLAGFFSPSIQERIEPDEMVKDYAQIIWGLPQESLMKLKECDLYCLGSIDNVTGEIIPEKQFLLHCSGVVSKFLKVESEEKKDDVSA